MKERGELAAETRTVSGKKVRRLRAQGLVPGVLYGGHGSSVPLQVDEQTMKQLLRREGSAALIDLKVDGGKPQMAMIKQIQLHPTTDEIIHVDFHRVAAREKTKAKVPLRFVGQAPVLATHDVVVAKQGDHITVEGYPADLPKHIDVDLTLLESTNSNIRVSDVQPLKGIAILDQPDVVLASVVLTSREPVAEAPAAEETEVEQPVAAAEKEAAPESGESREAA